MSFDSMIYTLGTALNHAMDSNTPVELLVQGQWVTGQVLAVDGHGLVLEHSEDEHSVIRVEQISMVRVSGPAPFRAAPAVPLAPVSAVPAQRAAAP
jgi:hypothetical protein